MNRSTPGTPNVALLVSQHVRDNLAEVEAQIVDTESRLADLRANAEQLRAIARAAGVDVTAQPEPLELARAS